MRRERSTLLGTPILLAPEAIRLSGDFAVPGEELVLFSAISSFATAQYFPRVQPLSQLVDTAVDWAKADLGEAADALPAGSVLLSPSDSHAKKRPLSDEAGPAIAVATVAAVFETAGQTISERIDQILNVAAEAYRQHFNRSIADAELAAAVYGGLIAIGKAIASPPMLLRPPMGLQLVIFKTGSVLNREQLAETIQQFAEDEPKAYAPFLKGLHESVTRFVEDLDSGDSASAIASFGRYGQTLTATAAAVSMPITSDGLTQATLLAKELGGAAKPSDIGSGDLGLALFATPEAAERFIRACQSPLETLPFELQRQGVHCRVLAEPTAAESVHTPKPDNSTLTYEPAVRSPVDIEQTEENQLDSMDSAAESKASATSTQLMVLAAGFNSPWPPLDAATNSPATPEPETSPPTAFFAIPRKWVSVVLLAAIGLVVVIWSALPILKGPKEGRLTPLPVQPLVKTPLPRVAKPPVREEPEISIPKLVEKILDELPTVSPDGHKIDAKASTKAQNRKKRLARVRESTIKTAEAPAPAQTEPRSTFTPRAGKLSSDDF